MQTEEVKVTARSNPSQRIIAVGIVFAFLYFASNIVITLLLAVLLAYFLDPVVGLLERIHIPRAIGALLVILAVTAILVGMGYLVVGPRGPVSFRLAALQCDLAPCHDGVRPPDRHRGKTGRGNFASGGERADSVRTIEPPPCAIGCFEAWARCIRFCWSRRSCHSWFSSCWPPSGASGKRRWNYFPTSIRRAFEEALDQVSSMLRSFVAGNALVALILMLSSWAFFLLIHLDYPFLAGLVSGLLNLVPYLGAVLAWIPPFLIGMAQWSTVGPYLGVAAMLTLFHIDRSERPDARDCWAARPFERPFRHRRVAVLGMALGRDRTHPGDPHYGDDQGGLRSRGGLGTGGPLARRVSQAMYDRQEFV